MPKPSKGHATKVSGVQLTVSAAPADRVAAGVARCAWGPGRVRCNHRPPRRADPANRPRHPGDEAEAHDAAQEAFVAAGCTSPSAGPITVRRVAASAARQRLPRDAEAARTEPGDPDGNSSVFSRFAGESVETASVKAAFGRLPIDQRTILLLHHLHGMPLDQVARHLDVPVGTAKSRLWHARRSLERALEAEA